MDVAELNSWFDWSHTLLPYPAHLALWQIPENLADLLRALFWRLPEEYRAVAPDVWVGQGVRIADSVHIDGPCLIDHGATLRPHAYVRGGVLIGKNAIVGHATELKNALLFDEAKAPHFNYVGDSILGYRAHIGAGVICSNVRLDHRTVRLCLPDGTVLQTGLTKLGALVADRAEVGCNRVLNPGMVLAPGSILLPYAERR
ncbi:MAG: UDP-N-acetylglucosamine pyrophosphorylase [Clostridia bacterium]|nr:UDP-N-acetylglucosamine pyrophosphorylase [Clostridia bacterium]